MAHNGVLFLDELPEFPRRTLEALRQPLEDGTVTIVRARHSVKFPARTMLVAAMNPCPCGYRGSGMRTCTCSDGAAQRYAGRLSGPLLDRFDIFVQVAAVPTDTLLNGELSEPSCRIAARVLTARATQHQRFKRSRVHCNAQMNPRQLRKFAALDRGARSLIRRYVDQHQISARAVHRCCRVARTLADLDGSTNIANKHVAVALTLQQRRVV